MSSVEVGPVEVVEPPLSSISVAASRRPTGCRFRFDRRVPVDGSFGRFSSRLCFGPSTSNDRLLATVVSYDGGPSSSTSRVVVVSPGARQRVRPVTGAVECVYDCTWLCARTSLVAARGLPLHLYDTEGGGHLASYSAYDAWSDTFEGLYSTCAPCARGVNVSSTVYGGSTGGVYAWDVTRPGKHAMACMYPCWEDGFLEADAIRFAGQSVTPRARRKRKHDIVSTLAVEGTLLAAGAYSGRVALFDTRTHHQELYIDGLSNGVTQVAFCDQYLYVACRGKGDLFVFDMRASGMGSCVFEIRRGLDVGWKERVGFAVAGRYLVSGVGEEGGLMVWDARDGREVGSCGGPMRGAVETAEMIQTGGGVSGERSVVRACSLSADASTLATSCVSCVTLYTEVV